MVILCLGAGALAGLCGAVVSFLIYPNLWVAATTYILLGHVVLVALLGALSRRPIREDQEMDDPELEADLAALRESQRQDGRFHAGTPDRLQPILFRTLRLREGDNPKARTSKARLDSLA
jgi:hypothetical protein